jgi:Shelterin complex subunit, TPP1/ACD
MANSIQAPWIKKKVLSILGESSANRHRVITLSAKIVQVIDANASVGTICVSDRSNSITVMLTPDCVTELMKQYSNLSDIRYNFVKLVSYHFSTPLKCVGSRDITKFKSQNISFPLVMQCGELVPLGGFDCTVLGNPCDINKDEDFTKLLSGGMQHIDLAAKLGVRQFPSRGSLPNAGDCCEAENFSFSPSFPFL